MNPVNSHSPSVAAPSKWRQQFALDLPDTAAGKVWVHACSVGEVSSIAPLIRKLLAAGHGVHLTVVTRTGFAHAQRLFGSSISQSWLPWDLPFLIARLINKLRPSLLLLCETEFWPGMLKGCKKRHISVVGVNTRISDRSFPKYFSTRKLWGRWLSNVALFLAQSDLDAERLAAIGVTAANIKAVGNLKFAVQAPEVDAAIIREHIDPTGKRPILILASTHDDEEAQIIKSLPTWLHICPDLLTLIVPRHPERFAAVGDLLKSNAIPFSRYVQKRSEKDAVVLVDAMGVLGGLYTIADIAFIGGSLVNVGGHNPLEAAICGRGVITGPYVQNFRAVMDAMQAHDAAIVVENADALEASISKLLQQPETLKNLHAQATLFMHEQEHVLDAMWQEIQPYLPQNSAGVS